MCKGLFGKGKYHAVISTRKTGANENVLMALACEGTLKIILIWIFRKKIDAFCKQIETKPFLPDHNRGGNIEYRYIQNAIIACNYQGYIFYVLVVGIVLPKIFYSLRDSGYNTVFDPYVNATIQVKRKRAGPFNCVVPFNAIDSPYFEIVAIYQALSASIHGCIIGSVDAFICGIMCHLKAQLLILKNSLRTYIQRGVFLMKQDNHDHEATNAITVLKKNDNTDEVGKLPLILQKYVHIAVNEIIVHHQKVIQLGQDAEETFSLLMLVQFLFSLSIICCQLFQLSILTVGSAQFYSMCLYAILMLFQIFLFCYRGNEVMLHSYDIIDAIFASDWVIIATKTQKSLLLMMTRASEPIRLTAGKFVFLSLVAFMSLIGFADNLMMIVVPKPEEVLMNITEMALQRISIWTEEQ
ncbi:hypothetical protein Trydic_g22807 [Trypoxylus dichotomus]